MPTTLYRLTDGTDVIVDCIGSAPDPSLPVVVLLHGMGGLALDMTDPGNAYRDLSFNRSVFFPLYKDEGVHLGPPLLPAARFYLDPVNPPASLTSWNAALKAAGFTTITYTQTSSTPLGGLVADDVAQLTLLVTQVLMAGTFAGVSLSGLRVAFVCHSRGGLVARSFLGGAGANPALAGFLSLVTALITLHSPNTGSGLAGVAATVAGLFGRLATAFAGAGLSAGAAAATALSGLVLTSMRAELVPGSATLTAIAAAEPVAGVTYHTFGGISTDFARIWADVYTPDSTIPLIIPLVPFPLFHWGSTPVVVGVPVNIASFVPAVLVAPTPFVTEIITVLAALAAATPDIAPGQGDLLVSDARSRLPFSASHTTNFLNHLEALSDPTLQAQVVAILLRLRSPVMPGIANGVSDVAVAPLSDERLELWVVDGASRLLTTWKTTTDPNADWVPWWDFLASGSGNPGPLANGARQIAVAPLSDERLELWAVDGAGRLLTTWKTTTDPNADWVPWWDFLASGSGNPGPLANGARQIAVAPLSDERLELWVVDGAGGLLTTWKTTTDPNADWVPWWDFLAPGSGNPGPLANGARQIAVAPLSDERLELWVVDGADGLLTTWKTTTDPNADWVPWWDFLAPGSGNPGPLASGARQIAVAPLSDERLELWVVDGAGGLLTTWKTTTDPNADWVPWWDFLAPGSGNPGPLANGARQIAVAPLSDERLELWVVDGAGGLLTTSKTTTDPNADWTPWSDFLA